MPTGLRPPNKRPMLDDLSLGGMEDPCWLDIDAGFTKPDCERQHGAIARVVVRMDGGAAPYGPGVELAKRIILIPDMIAALKGVMDAESIYDAKTAAKTVLDYLDIKL